MKEWSTDFMKPFKAGILFVCLFSLSVVSDSLYDPADCSPPGSSVHGISQARILEWVVIFFSRESSQPKDLIGVSCIVRQILYHWATWEALKIGIDMYKFTSSDLGVSLLINCSKNTNLNQGMRNNRHGEQFGIMKGTLILKWTGVNNQQCCRSVHWNQSLFSLLLRCVVFRHGPHQRLQRSAYSNSVSPFSTKVRVWRASSFCHSSFSSVRGPPHSRYKC